MNASDLTDPIHSVLDRIPVQEMIDRVPTDVLEYVPERFRTQDDTHRGRWMLLILAVVAAVGAAVMMQRRRAAMADEQSADGRRDGEFSGGVSVIQ